MTCSRLASCDDVDNVRHNTYKYLYILISKLDTSMQGIDFLCDGSLVTRRPLIQGPSIHVPPHDAELTLAFLVNAYYWLAIFVHRLETDIPYDPCLLDSFWRILYYPNSITMLIYLFLRNDYICCPDILPSILSIHVSMRPCLTPPTNRPPPHPIITFLMISYHDTFILMTKLTIAMDPSPRLSSLLYNLLTKPLIQVSMSSWFIPIGHMSPSICSPRFFSYYR